LISDQKIREVTLITLKEAEERWAQVSYGIKSSFKFTPRPADPELFDGFPDLGPEEQDYLSYLENKTWRKVDISECGSVIQYLSISGWRHFLPAYLLEVTPLACNDLGFQFPIGLCILWPRGLDTKRSVERIGSLSRAEFDAVREYMRFAADAVGGGALSAWKEFWEKAKFLDFPDVI
jgi:hypothetical protein